MRPAEVVWLTLPEVWALGLAGEDLTEALGG